MTLSNDISNIKMDKINFRKSTENLKNEFFSRWFLTSDISLDNLFSSLKLYRHGVKVWTQGTMSQMFFYRS